MSKIIMCIEATAVNIIAVFLSYNAVNALNSATAQIRLGNAFLINR